MEQKLIEGLPVVFLKGKLQVRLKDLDPRAMGIAFPYLDEIKERFDKEDTGFMAFDDLLWGMKVLKESSILYDFKETLHDVTMYSDSAICHVCGHVAFPDDEMYSCILTNKPVCTAHSKYSNEFNGYVTYLISEKS